MLDDVMVVNKLLKCGLLEAKCICECANKEKQGLSYDYIDSNYIFDLLKKQGFEITLINRQEYLEDGFGDMNIDISESYVVSKDNFEYEIKTYNGKVSPERILDLARMWIYKD